MFVHSRRLVSVRARPEVHGVQRAETEAFESVRGCALWTGNKEVCQSTSSGVSIVVILELAKWWTFWVIQFILQNGAPTIELSLATHQKSNMVSRFWGYWLGLMVSEARYARLTLTPSNRSKAIVFGLIEVVSFSILIQWYWGSEMFRWFFQDTWTLCFFLWLSTGVSETFRSIGGRADKQKQSVSRPSVNYTLRASRI